MFDVIISILEMSSAAVMPGEGPVFVEFGIIVARSGFQELKNDFKGILGYHSNPWEAVSASPSRVHRLGLNV